MAVKSRRPTEDAVAETQPHACSAGRRLGGHGQEYHCQKECRKTRSMKQKLERKAGLESQDKPENLSKEKDVFPVTYFWEISIRKYHDNLVKINKCQ